MKQIILASSSPRRKELLEQMGINVAVHSQNADESIGTNIAPSDAAVMLAQRKLTEAIDELHQAGSWILAADTIVYRADRMYGKAAHEREAKAFLQELSGSSHRVVTGLALYCPVEERIVTGRDETVVHFAPMSRSEIDWYVATDEWKGVAGAYRIQGLGSRFILGIEGSYSTVMGLPIRTLYSMLVSNGFAYLGEV